MSTIPTDPALPPLSANTPRPPAGQTPEARRRAALAFEGQVLGALLQPMFEGTEAKGLFGGGAGEAQWRPLLVEEIGKAIAKAGGLGIADAVTRQLDPGARR